MDQTNHYVVVKGLSKHFGASKVFEDLSFAIEEGEFITLLGPSGCGKSTLLRCLAGLETPDAGSIFVNGEDITHTKPQKRGIGMVFQSYALFPNMTAAENIAFGLKMQGLEKNEILHRVAQAIRTVELTNNEKKYPNQTAAMPPGGIVPHKKRIYEQREKASSHTGKRGQVAQVEPGRPP